MFICKFLVIDPLLILMHKISYGTPWIKGAIERDIATFKKQIDVEYSWDAMYEFWKI